MRELLKAIQAELLKIRHSPILWVTFIAFALGPVMGGVILLLLNHPGASSGMLRMKAEMMAFSIDWNSYFTILSQVVGVGGVLVFGFVASWLFGREYTDGTAKDLLALPVSRNKILNAKFFVYLLWCVALILSNLFLGLVIGWLIALPGFSLEIFSSNLVRYLSTGGMVIAVGTPISFFALWGRGYLAPIAFVALTLVFSQIIGALGAGHYFPWAIPGIFSGTAGEYRALVNHWSYLILIATTLAGYLVTVAWWRYADQK